MFWDWWKALNSRPKKYNLIKECTFGLYKFQSGAIHLAQKPHSMLLNILFIIDDGRYMA